VIRLKCDRGYFRSVVAHAKALGPDVWAKLRDQLSVMSNPHNFHGRPGFARRCVMDLYKDFAPHSFEFVRGNVEEDGTERRLFNGGLIFYAGRESGVSGQFSVTTSGLTGPRWESHT
jgi:hypothetical protein